MGNVAASIGTGSCIQADVYDGIAATIAATLSGPTGTWKNTTIACASTFTLTRIGKAIRATIATHAACTCNISDEMAATIACVSVLRCPGLMEKSFLDTFRRNSLVDL